MGENWSVIEHLDGKQIFLFVPVVPNNPEIHVRLFFVEFIMNPFVYDFSK